MVTPFNGEAGVRGHRHLDLKLLDDPAALEAADPGRMLRATASAGAQVRESAALAAEANLGALADDGRPRAVVIAGVGTAARTGDVLATVAGPRCPVPIIAHRNSGIPGWVGAADVVIAVSASGRSPEALAAAEAAARRGARLVAIGPPDSELEALADRARAPFIALTIPVLLAARTLGLVKINESDPVETAARLDLDADRCRAGLELFVNPAKSLALDLANSIPVVWGSSPLATLAARRFADTLSANARYPAIPDSLVEAGRGRVGLLDGVYGALAESGRDIFADPGDDSQDPTRLRLVVLRDGGLHDDEDTITSEPTVIEERRADAVQALAERRGVRVSVVTAEGASPLERLASLIAVPDFASVYLGLAHGLDPMAVPAVSEMKDLSNQ
jgi:glucose/mannose-6-phosphate isomerase